MRSSSAAAVALAGGVGSPQPWAQASTSCSIQSWRLHCGCPREASAAAAAAAGTAAAGSSPTSAGPSPFIVLGIESSCDDTGVAVVNSRGEVLGEAIATQADINAQWGGVVPSLARDAHAAAIDCTVEAALAAAGVAPEQLAAVAVTVGPGLSLCLRVGAVKARQLARRYGKPLVSVHHMEAHALVARLPADAAARARPAVRTEPQQPRLPGQQAAAELAAGPLEPASRGSPAAAGQPAPAPAPAAPAASTSSPPHEALPPCVSPDPGAVLADVAASSSLPFPFLCLLVSGGHNLLVLVRGVGSYVQLGTTLDDALGEAYDKVARLLGLDMRPHGGAALEALAREGDTAAFKLVVPMRKYPTCDFSFAGLKTSTRLVIEQQLRPEAVAGLSEEQLRKLKADIAASFQAVAVRHLVEKSRRGVGWARELAPSLQHLVVAGGVACNKVVRQGLQDLAAAEGLELVLPPPRWCTDNGVMVAWAGIERLATGWAEPPPPPQLQPGSGAAAGAGASTGAGAAPAAPAGPAAAQEEEWIELKPRWPLTSELHPRAVSAEGERRSAKKVRLHTPLSDLTPPAQQA